MAQLTELDEELDVIQIAGARVYTETVPRTENFRTRSCVSFIVSVIVQRTLSDSDRLSPRNVFACARSFLPFILFCLRSLSRTGTSDEPWKARRCSIRLQKLGSDFFSSERWLKKHRRPCSAHRIIFAVPHHKNREYLMTRNPRLATMIRRSHRVLLQRNESESAVQQLSFQKSIKHECIKFSFVGDSCFEKLSNTHRNCLAIREFRMSARLSTRLLI